ncbi:hypothetical protein DPEC_G00275520 [Dallia pectoralis]|uniref:Uncharacterized protein n=1 Tax=Dallia pectoralis TaxID=75939 RepID=A0ACC2FLE9_DALPE|nr:hypothetical protein DPEC_G00275520 [Dallia pectoralis]
MPAAGGQSVTRMHYSLMDNDPQGSQGAGFSDSGPFLRASSLCNANLSKHLSLPSPPPHPTKTHDGRAHSRNILVLSCWPPQGAHSQGWGGFGSRSRRASLSGMEFEGGGVRGGTG